jgi:hypothetical protein
MGMRGPPPKAPGTRQRRNRVLGAATLPSTQDAAKNRVPALPTRPGGWHVRVSEWWRAIWRSPMASEWLDSDLHGGLSMLAALYQLRWTADNPADLVRVAAEIRLQESRFGLSPTDRRRLQWEVSRGEEAEERRKARKPSARQDPRDVLKFVP